MAIVGAIVVVGVIVDIVAGVVADVIVVSTTDEETVETEDNCGVGDCGGASSTCTAACIAKLSEESNFRLQTVHVTESPVCSVMCASLYDSDNVLPVEHKLIHVKRKIK